MSEPNTCTEYIVEQRRRAQERQQQRQVLADKTGCTVEQVDALIEASVGRPGAAWA